jgi:hypothetical protein
LKFQFAQDPAELERCPAPESCEETKVQSGAGIAEWSDLIPEEWEWWAYDGVYFRIVAGNGFGVSEGAILYFQNDMFGAPPQPVPSDVPGGEPAASGASTVGVFP